MKHENKTNKLINILLKKNVKICAAESITGGRFAFEIIKNENASKIFDYGLVTYSNDSKSNILGLKDKINKTNVVSKEMSKYMVKEVTKFSNPQKSISSFLHWSSWPNGFEYKLPNWNSIHWSIL
ncbi:MAG: hypothetical protein CM15mP40_13540 [Alphaproteobacteria bacterium]|nr:MAG: hypothetical protein CM15mP40_13540 [Alphaproteobacteria bacterium]